MNNSNLEKLTELNFNGFVRDLALSGDVLYVLVEHQASALHNAPRYEYSLVQVKEDKELSRRKISRKELPLTSMVIAGETAYIGSIGEVIRVKNGREETPVHISDSISSGVRILLASHDDKVYALHGNYLDLEDYWSTFDAELIVIENSKIQSRVPLGKYGSSAQKFRTLAVDKGDVYVGLANNLKIIRDNQVVNSHNFGQIRGYRDEPRNIMGVARSGKVVYVGLDRGTIAIIKDQKIESEFGVDIPQQFTDDRTKSTGGELSCLAADGEHFFVGSSSGHLVYGNKEKHFSMEGDVGAIGFIVTDKEHLYLGAGLGGHVVAYKKPKSELTLSK